ncbi:MAG: nucleoside hydrolase [Caldilineae bacterium]|nr:MAG: nucleoside hydrolase [Caldilineae bacterium]
MIPVLLDVDTGVDDALALLLAARSPQLKVLGVTCVAGNVPLPQVVRNTLTVLDAAERADIPVAAGFGAPLVEPFRPATHVHGEDGLGLPDWPRSTRQPVTEHAVDFMAQILREAEAPVTLIALAPLTNVAGLVRRHPELLARIERIVSMGGSAFTGGNMTAAAEFNIGCDPEAAAIVYGSRTPITMYGLDVFRQVAVPAGDVERLANGNRSWSPLLGALLHYLQRRFELADPGLGDAGAVAAVLLPEALTTRPYRVDIELTGTHTRGMTVVDRRVRSQDARAAAPPNADVAVAIDGAACARLFVNALG